MTPKINFYHFFSSLFQADLLKSDPSNPIEIFTIGIGSKYNRNELKSIASSPSDFNYIHVDDFESLFSITNDLAQRVCSVQAEIEFDVKVNVTCLENEMRYFKASTNRLTKDFIAIYKNQRKGDAILYHSFTYKNPDSFYNDAVVVNTNKNHSRNIEFPSKFLPVEKNPEELVYVSMQCVGGNKENEIEILLRNEDL